MVVLDVRKLNLCDLSHFTESKSKFLFSLHCYNSFRLQWPNFMSSGNWYFGLKGSWLIMLLLEPVMLTKINLKLTWPGPCMNDFPHHRRKHCQKGFAVHGILPSSSTSCFCGTNARDKRAWSYSIKFCMSVFVSIVFSICTWNLGHNLGCKGFVELLNGKLWVICDFCLENEAFRALELPSGVRIQGTDCAD